MPKVETILIGTSKGLIVFEKKIKGWQIQQVHFLGMPVAMVYIDKRTHTWWVGIAHRHWGQKLHFSQDNGQSWQAVNTPKYPIEAAIYPGKKATMKKIWCMQQAGPDKPGGLWLGTEPGGLFYSADNGKSFDLVEGLWNHPSRQDQNQWFGAGRDFPFIHSIVVDPRDSNHVYIAVSCAGVFETKDAGLSWTPCNNGLIAAYLPNPVAEVGHDPHLLLACEANPDILWQQNHCGIFRSTNAGQSWDNVTDKKGLADYGFALAIDHKNPERAWVIPAVSDEMRIAQDLALCVCKTEDGGQSWQPLRSGLPQHYCFDIVFRHSLGIHENTLVFGTTTGNLFISDNFGEDWHCLSNHLPRVDCVALV
ncbi:MAG: hypothetical protein R2828_16290 [Saprospiraceae bacterium]